MAAKRRFSSRTGVSCAAILRACQYTLLVAGFGLVGYCALAFIEARLYQENEQRVFDKMARSTPQSLPERAAPPIRYAVLGRIVIPQLGLSAMIAEGDDRHTLMRAVGHIPGTAMPGQPGNAVLAAHRDTFFRPLRKIRKGDAIELTTWSGSYRYRVESIQVVEPQDIGVLEPTSQSKLTLITCYPFYFVGSAPKRFIVRAGLMPG